MDRISNKMKCMASLAVFRALYNGKKDIYAIISEFIKLIIINRNIKHFELQQMIIWVSDEYGFNLPEAVIKRSVNKLNFLEKSRTQYTVTTELNNKECQNIQNNLTRAQQSNNILTEALLEYAKQNDKDQILTSIQIEELKKAFYSFVIDEKAVSPEFGAIISGFIISISENKELKGQLNKIRQGMIIYIGLTYNTEYHTIDDIDTPLYIYLDTEILFSMAGYNGTLYKTLFDEFYDLVIQINKRFKNAPIHFRYFTETRIEIETYFSIAEDIVCNKQQLDPSKQAMSYIVSLCKSAHHVKEMLIEFNDKLKNLNIKLDAQEAYYDKDKMQFSIEHNTVLYELRNDYTEDDILKKLRLLNYINIKRGNKSQKIFRNVGHILLSANKLVFKLAYHKDIYQTGCIPLVTDLDFLTNRFWLSLNKGLSQDMILHSFDIITKAQIALSALVNDSVGQYYDELKNEIEQKKLSTEKIKQKIAALRQISVKPEDINSTNENTYINIISIDEVDRYIAEKYYEIENQRKETKLLKEKVIQIEHESFQKDKKLYEMAQKLADQKNHEYADLFEKEMQKYEIKKQQWIEAKYKKKKYEYLRTVLIYLFVIFILIIMTFFLNSIKWISAATALIMLVIPFIRPLVDHTSIRNAFLFCLFKSERNRYISSLEDEYKDYNNKPILQQITVEDIIKSF